MKKLPIVVLLAANFVSNSVSAALVTYTNRATFEGFIASSGAIVREDFNSRPLETFTAAFSKDYGDFTIASSNVASDTIGVLNTRFEINGGPTAGSPNIDGTPFFGLHGSDGGPTFTISFDTPRFVFGFDYVDTDTTDSYAVTVLGTTFEGPPFGIGYTGTDFFGIFSDTAFSQVSFGQTAAGGFIAGFGVDNLTTSGTAVEVPGITIPEPSSMFALGLLFGGGALIRQRSRAANR